MYVHCIGIKEFICTSLRSARQCLNEEYVNSTVLYCVVLSCTVLHCTALHCTAFMYLYLLNRSVWDGWMNQVYSRLSTTHGHITDCKLDSVVYAGVSVVILIWTCLVWAERSTPDNF